MLVERKEHKNENQEIDYIESIYKSDNVLKTTYFLQLKKLYIAFNRGNTFSYTNIDNELYEEFENAESQGKFFHKRINKNDKFPFRKEFTLFPTEIKECKDIVESSNQNNEKNNL